MRLNNVCLEKEKLKRKKNKKNYMKYIVYNKER